MSGVTGLKKKLQNGISNLFILIVWQVSDIGGLVSKTCQLLLLSFIYVRDKLKNIGKR